jgi:hypothetical protein
MNLHIQKVTIMCQEAAINAVEKFSEEQLTAHGVDQLTEYIVTDKVPQPIRLDMANHEVTSDVVMVPPQQGLVYGGIIMCCWCG